MTVVCALLLPLITRPPGVRAAPAGADGPALAATAAGNVDDAVGTDEPGSRSRT